jgi:sulfur carrier protein ThiS
MTVQIQQGSTVEDLLRILHLKPDTVIALAKKKPIPVDDLLSDKQKLTILQVSSGG